MVYTNEETSLSKKNSLDQYYTSRQAVDIVFDVVQKYWGGERLLEPSAGSGAFYNNTYPRYLMFDIEPKATGIIQADFLKVDPREFEGCFAVGNPPFGFCGKLAVKFINHCAESCNKICFILPNTFKKELFFDRHLNKHLHLVEVADLPKNSFILHNEVYDVPCSVFYMEKIELPRETLVYYNYLHETVMEWGVPVRRVGGRAGQIVETYTPSSTYMLASNFDTVEYFLDKYKEEIKQVASYTAGVRSITVDEINLIISRGEA
jgi:hypothetical protein